MMRTGQDVRSGAAVAVGLLLLGIIGCSTTIEAEPPESRYDRAIAEATGEAPETPAAWPSERAATAEPAAVDAPAAPRTEPPTEPFLRVHEIRVADLEGTAALLVHLSRPPDVLHNFTLDNPERMVLDLEGPVAMTVRSRTHAVNAPGLYRVRVGAYEKKIRVVVDLDVPLSDVDVTQSGRVVAVRLLKLGQPVEERTVYVAPGIVPAAIRGDDEAIRLAADAPLDDAPAEAAYADASALPAERVAARDEPIAPAVEPWQQDRAAEPWNDPAPDPGGEQAYNPDPPAVAPAPLDPDVELPWETETSEPQLREAAAPTADRRDPWLDEDPAYVLPVQDPRDDLGALAAIDGESLAPAAGGQPPYSGQRISLDFKDADIQNVLRILADVSGLNIITTEDVQGKLTMRLVDVPWDQALAAILKAQGLDMVQDGNILRVSTVERLKQERDAQRAADEAQKQAEPLQVRYVKVNYAKVEEKLVEKVQEVLTERGSATWDERTNTIVIRDIARGIESAEELISHFDTQTPQVLIEANIVEATENVVRDLGIQWGYTYRASPEVGNAPGYNFPGRVRSGGISGGSENLPAGPVPFIADFPANIAGGDGSAYDIFLGSLDGAHTLNARLTALEGEGKTKIISRPRVVTLNNVPATIESLRIVRVRLPSTGTVIATGAGGAAGGSQNATEQIRTGIILRVTPQISSDGYVFLDVKAKSSVLDRTTTTDDIPEEVSREANSHVLIKDGETFVLGGVFRNVRQDSQRGVPFLRSVPVVGWVFRNTFTSDDRQELLVFVTPRIVRARGTEDLASLPSAEVLWHNRDRY